MIECKGNVSSALYQIREQDSRYVGREQKQAKNKSGGVEVKGQDQNCEQ
jgi:hypothetical protein